MRSGRTATEYNAGKSALPAGVSTVRRFPVFALPVVLILILCAQPAQPEGQGRGFPQPPAPPEPLVIKNDPSQQTVIRRIDVDQLQREATDLATTAQSIPADVENLKRGILPKDTLQKLKQIEKISKRLRNQLTP
jgi:hypothetical protein